MNAGYGDQKEENTGEFVDLKDDPNCFVFDAYDGPSHTEEDGAQAKAATAPPFAIDLIFKPELHFTDKKSGYLDPANYLVYEATQEGEGKKAKYVIKDKNSPLVIGYVDALANSDHQNRSQPGPGRRPTRNSPDKHSGVRSQGAQLDPHQDNLVTYLVTDSQHHTHSVKNMKNIIKKIFWWWNGHIYMRT